MAFIQDGKVDMFSKVCYTNSVYDHTKPTIFTREECEAAVGQPAGLVLTGRIVEAGESKSGPFVKFQPDERFGFGDKRLVLDLDVLDL